MYFGLYDIPIIFFDIQILASKHQETLFLKISVLSSPFLVEKLSIKVLPCLITFGAKAQVKDRIVGFEDLGNSDGFTTKTLEWRLGQGGELERVSFNERLKLIFYLLLPGALRLASANDLRPIYGFPGQMSVRANQNNDDDDLDWD